MLEVGGRTCTTSWRGVPKHFQVDFVQLVLLTPLMSISDGDAVLPVSFDFLFPLTTLIASYRAGDVDKRWADFAWRSW